MAELKELWQMAEELVGKDDLARRCRMWLSTIIRKERIKRQNSDSGALFDEDVLSILSDLNRRTGSRFGATDTAKHMISSLLKRGYTPQDFCRVHEVKTIQWLGDAKMEHCLRPSTLYRPSHFDEYLAQWWKFDRQRRELEDKRRKASNRQTVTHQRVVDTEREALIAQLMATPWHAHDSWLDFMRHTVRFPDSDSLQKYPMPAALRALRQEPGMMIAMVKKAIPPEAEALFDKLKKESSNA